MSLGNAIQPSLHQLQGLDLDLLDYIPEIEGRRFRSGRKQFLPRKVPRNSSWSAVPELVESFDGLEEPFVSTNLKQKPFDVWRAVLCHKSTLKKFVQYQKGLREIPYNTGPDATVLFNRNRDTVGIGESLDDTAFVEFDLECLDLCCNVEDLQDITIPKSSVRWDGKLCCNATTLNNGSNSYIKIRKSYPHPLMEEGAVDSQASDLAAESLPELLFEIKQNLHEFAACIFGPEGLTSSANTCRRRILRRRKVSNKNVLLCQNSERVVTVLLRIYNEILSGPSYGNARL
ncbi:hypothetical protein PABG_03845 [Paracoccidioides brasiliensis Pb03]|nr:hypothetical protein PABG_03845 [Paracoccidioides brasiliensis Pb03]